MPINPVSLIAGALSFSAAIAWNKAISESLNNASGGTSSSMTQALVITILIVIVVIIINFGISIYSKFNNTILKQSVIRAGGDSNSKVQLWLTR